MGSHAVKQSPATGQSFTVEMSLIITNPMQPIEKLFKLGYRIIDPINLKKSSGPCCWISFSVIK
ncbi:hypothetical protein D0463_06040 [Bacillus sp. V59.32b]|nr:hypothetical protein D0463_06040 [Bacillus sp. V59.32b]